MNGGRGLKPKTEPCIYLSGPILARQQESSDHGPELAKAAGPHYLG
jgi:hypothetical protein